jgi:NADPH:quinone reductase-like Zn-dependent oxidoreductase
MRALQQFRYGPPKSVLRLVELPEPRPGRGEVLVRVAAASVNSWDWDKVVGSALGRLGAPFGSGQRVLGCDVAGTVLAVGEGVTRFQPGDRVFGDLSEGKWGGFAEQVAASEDALAPMPAGIGFVEAAALPQAGALALQGLRRRAKLGAGDRLLLNGAGGGVGTIALQLAKPLDVHITAVDRAEKLPLLKELGADEVVDYRSTDFSGLRDAYDLIIDVVADKSARRFASCLPDGGHLVMVGGKIPSLLSVGLFGAKAGRERGQTLELLFYRPSPADNMELAEAVVEGRLRPIIDSTFELADGAEAVARLGSGQAFGKVVVAIGN